MNSHSSTLHMVCGKIASGKSTLTKQLAAQDNTVLIAEDDWLSSLYGEELSSIQDYVRCTRKLRTAMAPHVAALLNAGVTVVLDFQANTVDARAWIRGILDASGATHELHVLDVPDAVCLARLRERNAQGEHPFAPTEEQFYQFSQFYVPPTPEEGFNIVEHQAPA